MTKKGLWRAVPRNFLGLLLLCTKCLASLKPYVSMNLWSLVSPFNDTTCVILEASHHQNVTWFPLPVVRVLLHHHNTLLI